TVTLTITGTNDAPVLTVDQTGSVQEDVAVSGGNLTDTGTLSFTDVDVTDTHTTSASYNSDAVWTGGSLTAGQVTAITSGFSVDSNSWDYTVANAALQFLAAGETITLSFDVTVTDDSGAANNSDTKTVTLTITGTILRDRTSLRDRATLRDRGSLRREAGDPGCEAGEVREVGPHRVASCWSATRAGVARGIRPR